MVDDRRRMLLAQMLGAAAIAVAFDRGSAAQERTGTLLAKAHEVLVGLNAPELASFLRNWPAVSTQRKVVPSPVPALRWLAKIQELAPDFAAPFVAGLVASAPSLAWRRSYSPALVGARFFDNYGWTELAGLTGPVPSERLACGLLVLGPDLSYPPHRHEADEIYVPLVGTAEWKHGGGHWRERQPGAVIHHLRYEPHAMQTGASPMLALYLWRSDNLAQQSHLDPSGSQ